MDERLENFLARIDRRGPQLTEKEAERIANEEVHAFREEQRLLGNPTYTREKKQPREDT